MTIREGLDWLLDTDISELFFYFVLVCFCLYLIRALGYVLLAVAEFFSSVEENLALQQKQKESKNKEELVKKIGSKFPELSPEELAEKVEREIARKAVRTLILLFGLCILVFMVLFNADKWVPLVFA